MDISISVYILCFCLVAGSQATYRAAVITTPGGPHPDRYESFIQDAAKLNVDILVLPDPERNAAVSSDAMCDVDNFNKIVKSISNAAKQGGLYVAAHLYEKVQCQNGREVMRTNMVFDRRGAILSVSRKPLNSISPCNTTIAEVGSFITDFGVTFAVLMQEDIVLQNMYAFKDVRNFVVMGRANSDVPFMTVSQLSRSWAYVNDANLVSAEGIIAGRSGLTSSDGRLAIAELNTEGGSGASQPPVVSNVNAFGGEDWGQYAIKPLDLEASARGYKETVCQKTFCCEFHVKTSSEGRQSGVSYGLAAFDGSRKFARHSIGAQSCAVVACAGLDKRSCFIGSKRNGTDTFFDEISVAGNFSKDNSAQYPVFVSTGRVANEFVFDRTVKSQVTVKALNSSAIVFGIFGRDFSRDTELFEEVSSNSFYDIIYSEDVQEFFDYMWIRVKVLAFVVSIYILEMM